MNNARRKTVAKLLVDAQKLQRDLYALREEEQYDARCSVLVVEALDQAIDGAQAAIDGLDDAA